jgi:hypothetical protein
MTPEESKQREGPQPDVKQKLYDGVGNAELNRDPIAMANLLPARSAGRARILFEVHEDRAR